MRGNRFDVGHRIGDSDRQANLSQNRQVSEIVSDERGITPIQTTSLQDFTKGRSLSGPGHLEDLFHSQLCTPQRGRFRAPAAEPYYWQACGTKEYQTEPVLNIEPLQLHSLTGDRADEHTIVGQNAVHIEANQPDSPGRRTAQRIHTRTRPQTSSVRLTKSVS
jgi:hypothetical protein